MTATRRDPWLDNTKMFLVTSVVVGHAWGLLAGTREDRWLYDFLYLWHIPAFVLVSGYLSRSFQWDRRGFRSLGTTLLVPYLIFEPALYWWRHSLGQVDTGHVLLVPHWTMWYLPALIAWRLLTPILRTSRLMLPIALAVSLAGGLWSGQILCLARIMGLLPFFVLGLHLSPARLAGLGRWWVRALALGALGVLLLLARDTDEWARTAFLYYDAGYSDLGWDTLPAVRVRMIVILIGLLASVCVLALVPRRGGWFSAMGSATMVVYLLHGFVISFAAYAGWGAWSEVHPRLAPVVTTAAAVALALGLASPPARRVLVWVVDPVNSWLRRRAAGDPGPANAVRPSATPGPPGRGPRR